MYAKYLQWKINIKRCALAGLRRRADDSLVIFSYFLANGKANTCALVFGFTVQALKDLKNSVGILLAKANAII